MKKRTTVYIDEAVLKKAKQMILAEGFYKSLSECIEEDLKADIERWEDEERVKNQPKKQQSLFGESKQQVKSLWQMTHDED